ncbi:hypothetical protein [Aquibacillus sediminis]|uniref:hypothetical protein n=1 Tax=Aquibacillus sediminis TaxID=2574734 RepID=UPI001107ECD8|nr:hypothetical protein [Aquibacillus sediminis]
MYTCPLCNGFREIQRECPSCHELMEDQGRMVDYMGDYIAYLDYDGTKLIDGHNASSREHVCIHLFYCFACDEKMHVNVQELRK